jgi:hypothetical protein
MYFWWKAARLRLHAIESLAMIRFFGSDQFGWGLALRPLAEVTHWRSAEVTVAGNVIGN